METRLLSSPLKPVMRFLLFFLIGITTNFIIAQTAQRTYVYKGEVINADTGDPLVSAHLSLDQTNISSVTNSAGEFSLKVPENLIEDASVTVSSLGFRSKTLPLNSFKIEDTRIELEESVEELSEVSVFEGGDAADLIRKVLDKKASNYFDQETVMTAFYRETIKKRRKNVSLSEAVVNIHKQPYGKSKKDKISLIKARKSTDYDKLDTLALKLRGGPFNALYVDVMKYPDFLFENEMIDAFEFSFDNPTRLNNRNIYVVNFAETNKSLPWYHGKLYIDSETLTLVKARYKLNVDNREIASRMFVKKKPNRAKVYPVDVLYQIDYRENNGRWYYGYGNAQLEFVVNWKNKIFNSRYSINSEMAVTDWDIQNEEESEKDIDFVRPSVVMADDISGFADAVFWGDTNIIEPDKSIENAIEKIQQQLIRERN